MIFQIIRTPMSCVFSAPKTFRLYDIHLLVCLFVFSKANSFSRHLLSISMSQPQRQPSWSSSRESRYVSTRWLWKVLTAVINIVLDTGLAWRNMINPALQRRFQLEVYSRVHQADGGRWAFQASDTRESGARREKPLILSSAKVYQGVSALCIWKLTPPGFRNGKFFFPSMTVSLSFSP